MISLNLGDFCQQVAAKEAVPGGGSVSAHAAAQAAALLTMYCRLSLGKKGLEELQPLLEQTIQEAEELMPLLLADIQRDSAAYGEVVAAFALPKDSEKEKLARSRAVQAAFVTAARVPLEVAGRSLRLLELVHRVAGRGNNNAITDIGVGNLLAWAGLQGALYNVRINLGSIKDQSRVVQLRDEADKIHAAGLRLHQENAAAVAALLD